MDDAFLQTIVAGFCSIGPYDPDAIARGYTRWCEQLDNCSPTLPSRRLSSLLRYLLG